LEMKSYGRYSDANNFSGFDVEVELDGEAEI
jgi:hypothetical protein